MRQTEQGGAYDGEANRPGASPFQKLAVGCKEESGKGDGEAVVPELPAVIPDPWREHCDHGQPWADSQQLREPE